MWYDRLTELREQAEQQPHRAGDEALLLLEDWLYERAKMNNFRKDRASMREYLNYIPRNQLSKEERARIERYTEIRNCLSHRGGLQMTASLANELLDFIERLFRWEATNAEDLMTPRPHTVQTNESLRKARDWMLENKVSRLPVVDGGGKVVGLLTNRDLIAVAAQKNGLDVESLTVGDAMSSDGDEKVAYVSRTTPYDALMDHLRNPNVAAIFVTDSGDHHKPLRGIISVSDLLPKL
jgi:CBS domain containing-hemolysin-like protein